MKPPHAIGSVPNLSGHAIAYRWRSLPRVRRRRASKPQGSSERVLPWQITMDRLIFASLSHTHYWYEMDMLKVPTAEPVSSDQILRRERRQGNIIFLYSADNEQNWQPDHTHTKIGAKYSRTQSHQLDVHEFCIYVLIWDTYEHRASTAQFLSLGSWDHWWRSELCLACYVAHNPIYSLSSKLYPSSAWNKNESNINPKIPILSTFLPIDKNVQKTGYAFGSIWLCVCIRHSGRTKSSPCIENVAQKVLPEEYSTRNISINFGGGKLSPGKFVFRVIDSLGPPFRSLTVPDVSSCTTQFPSTRVRIPGTLVGDNVEH